MFAIEVERDRVSGGKAGNPDEAVGRIRIGDFTETFRMDLGFWSESDYRHSWCRAFDVLEKGENSMSCLMASMTDPKISNFLLCWPLYRIGDVVYIQNSVIFLEEIGFGFDPDEPWLSVAPRCTVDDDGNVISEWVASIDSMRRFFRCYCAD